MFFSPKFIDLGMSSLKFDEVLCYTPFYYVNEGINRIENLVKVSKDVRYINSKERLGTLYENKLTYKFDTAQERYRSELFSLSICIIEYLLTYNIILRKSPINLDNIFKAFESSRMYISKLK